MLSLTRGHGLPTTIRKVLTPLDVRFASQSQTPYTYYSAEAVKQGAMPPDHKRLYQDLVAWEARGLKSAESGSSCGFGLALDSGTVAFAVVDTTGDYKQDYTNLKATYETLIQEHFSVLTQENADELKKKCLVIAMPEYISEPLKFASMHNVVRLDFFAETLERGLLNTGLHPMQRSPVCRTLPFPLIAIRYMVPEDKVLLAKMQDPEVAKHRFKMVYGDNEVLTP